MKKLVPDELGRMSVEEFRKSEKHPLVVILDNVRSMHNIGSVFRSCDAFGVECLYLCGITATPPHREIQRTALDATLSVKWEYHSEAAVLLKSLLKKGYLAVAVELTDEAGNLQDFLPDSGVPVALIFGNEVDGVSDSVLKVCSKSVCIPQFGTKHSLNVSVTAGIVLWDIVAKLKKAGQFPEKL